VVPVSSELIAARIYELQVFGEPGTNLAINRPATSSAACDSSETADKAVNGSVRDGISDKWCSNAAGTKWLKADLALPSLINRIMIKHAHANAEDLVEYNTRDFNVEASTDDVRWTTLFTATGNTRPVTAHAFPPISARYVRLNVTNAGVDGIARIYELEVYGQSGLNAALNRPTSSTTTCNTTQTAAKAVDGSTSNTNSKWCSTLADPTKYWMKVDLGAAHALKWFTLKHAGMREDVRFNSKDFTIWTSTDNSNWTMVDRVVGNTKTITTHPITPISARWVRVNVLAPTSGIDSRARLYELEAYR
jgi:hypothetical protein